MSCTEHTATAICSLKHTLDVTDLCHELYDYFTNHEGEIPESLADCTSVEEFADIVENYVALTDNELTITMNTEESNYDHEIFDVLSSHYAYLMSSKFMKVTYITYDSGSGLSADISYYNNNNEFIDIKSLIESR
jgi:hypothetical protein